MLRDLVQAVLSTAAPELQLRDWDRLGDQSLMCKLVN